MKKVLLIAIVGVILFLTPSYVYALDNNANSGATPQAPIQGSSGGCILVYADGTEFKAPNTIVDQALKDLNKDYTAFYNGNFAGFEAALANMKPCCVIFDNQNNVPPTSTYDALNAYVLGGGKLVMTSWRVHKTAHPLWATLGVDQSSAVEVIPPTMASLYQWDTSNPIFNKPNIIPNPLVQTALIYGQVNAIREKLIGAATALAGYTMSPAAGEAFIVVSNNGRTLLNTFLLDPVNNWSAYELMENEIVFICAQPVGGELVSDSALNIGSVLSSILLVSIAVVAATSVSMLTVWKRRKG